MNLPCPFKIDTLAYAYTSFCKTTPQLSMSKMRSTVKLY